MASKENLIKKFTLFNSYKIELQTIAYGFNLFLPTLIIILVSFFQNYIFISELSILVGTNIIFTQIFSANSRPLIIKNKDNSLLNFIIRLRMLIGTILILLNFTILYLIDSYYFFQLLLISIIIICQWIVEIILTYNELKVRDKFFKYYILFSFLFFLSCLIEMILIRNLFYSLLYFNIFLILSIFIYIKRTYYKLSFSLFLNFFKRILLSNEFFSSLSLSLANLIWRILIIFFCGKTIAGVYFAGYAIGSLPGSLFNNTFGPKIIKEKIKLNKFWIKIFKFLLSILLILNSYILINFFEIFDNNINIQISCSIISFLGSYFMVTGLIKRQKLIQNTNNAKKVFSTDIFYSLIVILVIPTLFFLGGSKLIISAFLILSIFSFLVYNYIFTKFSK